MTVTQIKDDLYRHLGEEVNLKYHLGRNRVEEYAVKIKELYNHIFLVELVNSSEIKSFSYTDVITKTIRIFYESDQ